MESYQRAMERQEQLAMQRIQLAEAPRNEQVTSDAAPQSKAVQSQAVQWTEDAAEQIFEDQPVPQPRAFLESTPPQNAAINSVQPTERAVSPTVVKPPVATATSDATTHPVSAAAEPSFAPNKTTEPSASRAAEPEVFVLPFQNVPVPAASQSDQPAAVPAQSSLERGREQRSPVAPNSQTPGVPSFEDVQTEQGDLPSALPFASEPDQQSLPAGTRADAVPLPLNRPHAARPQSVPSGIGQIDAPALDVSEDIETASREQATALVKPHKPTQTPSVGFEQVYRFTTETVGQETRVVSGKGKVCPVCGKVHAPHKPHSQSTVTQVSGQRTTERNTRVAPGQIAAAHGSHQPQQTAAHSAPSAQEESQTTIQAQSRIEANSRRRTAGRGTNRHVRKASGDPEAKKSKGLLTVTTENDESDQPDEPAEPGMLHRISSAVRKIGNPVLK